MAEAKTIVLTWDPERVYASLPAYGAMPQAVRDLYPMIEEYDELSNCFKSHIRRADVWRKLHATFPGQIASPPKWLDEKMPEGITAAFEAAIHVGFEAHVDAYLTSLPAEYALARQRVSDASDAIRKSGNIHAFRDVEKFWFRIVDHLPSREYGRIALGYILDASKNASVAFEQAAHAYLERNLPQVEFVENHAYFERDLPRVEFVEKPIRVTPPAPGVLAAGEELATYDTSIGGASSTALLSLVWTDTLALATRYEAALELASRGPEPTLALCDHLIEVLRDAPVSDEWTHACVGLTEEIQLRDPERRQALAAGLLRVATELYPTPQREVAWVALLRWATLVPVPELAALSRFLAPGTEVETMQCAAQCLWNRLALEPSPPKLPTLEARCAALLSKGIDVDWLGLPFAGSLTANLLLAYATLASDADLATVIARARELGPDHFPWQLVRSKTRRMQAHVHAHALPSACVDRLQALLS